MADIGNILDISKIVTGVPGLDDLFYGGLRLPGWKSKDNVRDGICIVIYGDRGISKSDLAMQIMRGVNKHFSGLYGEGNKMTTRYMTLNHRETELKKKYIGLEVGEHIDSIKLPPLCEDGTSKCKICQYFPKVRERLVGCVYPDDSYKGECSFAETHKCPICKLIRHEVINYSDRSQSLHWTYGDTSNPDNLLDELNVEAIDTKDVFDTTETDNNTSDYTSIAYIKFQRFLREISDECYASERTPRHDGKEMLYFKWSSYVIEGFTAFRPDELERLPLSDLILKLRKTSAVSILVFDDRGKSLRLNADIIIHMQYSTYKPTNYTYYELQIDKCDLQQHVHGYHKYRKLRDLSVKIYPSVHSLLTKRFASDHAVLRLERDDMRYPQSLLNKFQLECAKSGEKPRECAAGIISDIIMSADMRGEPYDEMNNQCKVSMVDDKAGHETLMQSIAQSLQRDDTTVAMFLMGKTEQNFRRVFSQTYLPEYVLRNIHYWDANVGCIWAEEYLSIVREYIQRWKKLSGHRHLHIVVDDIANINMYPLIQRETLFIPALVNVCRNETVCQGHDENDRGISIELTLVCTNKEIQQYGAVIQTIENQ